jgi:hypothetical protein
MAATTPRRTMIAAGTTHLGIPDDGGEVTTTGGRRGDERISAGSDPGCGLVSAGATGGAGAGGGTGAGAGGFGAAAAGGSTGAGIAAGVFTAGLEAGGGELSVGWGAGVGGDDGTRTAPITFVPEPLPVPR